MLLTQKETELIKDLKTQEQVCVDKYAFYADSAKDPELKDLFTQIKKDEEEHLNSLNQVLAGSVPDVPHNKESAAVTYHPKGHYSAMSNEEDKKHDQLLCTDSIANEKYVSGAYNDDLFQFASHKVRELLNHIQTEEQTHAEMIYQYKTANGMTA